MKSSTEDGLANNNVVFIYQASDGVMWFGTMSGGVSRYDGITWTSLDVRDGLSNTVSHIQENEDGSSMFGTADGVFYYRPDLTPPKVRIISVETDKEYTDIQSIPAVGTGERVTIKFSSIDFKTLPEKRQYRCRVKEMDSDWSSPTKEDSFIYIFDKPGKYTFEVQAIDRDLNYSEPASLELDVRLDPRSRRIIQLEEHIRQQELAEMERMHHEPEDARQIQLSFAGKAAGDRRLRDSRHI